MIFNGNQVPAGDGVGPTTFDILEREGVAA